MVADSLLFYENSLDALPPFGDQKAIHGWVTHLQINLAHFSPKTNKT